MKKQSPIGKRYFIVRESIFQRKIHCFINWSGNEVDEYLERQARRKGIRTVYADSEEKRARQDDDFIAFSSSFVQSNGATEWIISVRDFDWTISDQGTLIHEIVHTVVKIWSLNNIPVTADTQEFLAHSIGNLYEDIAAKIWRVSKRKKKS